MASKWNEWTISDLRRKYDESQTRFCRRLGLRITAYANLEQGRQSPPPWIALLLDRLEEEIDEGRVRAV